MIDWRILLNLAPIVVAIAIVIAYICLMENGTKIKNLFSKLHLVVKRFKEKIRAEQTEFDPGEDIDD
jgi:uncharacterized protein YoxC